LRVGEELRHALAWILEKGEVRDPGLHGAAITVTEVRASPDLKNATVYVVPLGGGDATDAVDALNRAAPFLRHRIADKVHLKFTPKLAFQADTTFDAAQRIDDLLHEPRVSRDLAGDDEDDA
jgi:ribosome-binding factor A